MTGQGEQPLDIARGVTAILGALVLFSAATQVLEYTLVTALAGGTVKDMASYIAALNQPSLLAGKTAANLMVGLLAGYLAAKIARSRELMFASIAAAAETCSLVYGFSTGEYAVLPLWFRSLTVLTVGPAMIAGAWIRMQARLATGAHA